MSDIGEYYWLKYAKIICPECKVVQKAKEVFYKCDPWPTYIHDCEKCEYIIMESEWERVRQGEIECNQKPAG